MYEHTITLFNYYKVANLWYPTVITGTEVKAVKSNSVTANAGITNSDTVECIIHSSAAKTVTDINGVTKVYMKPKEYADCENPEEAFTFSPEQDFIYCDEWADNTPLSDDIDFDSGLYHSFNDKYDGVYMITSAEFYSLLPHFEIGGR